MRDFKIQKAAIVLILGALILADLGLGIYSWNRSSEQAAQQELAMLQKNVNLLKADISRGKEIQQEIPAVQKECDHFERSLFPQSSGYSSVSAELSTLANKAGLRIESRSNRPGELKGRGLVEVQINLAVTGNYHTIVLFLNALQRSPNMYAVDGLSARTASQTPTSGGLLHVGLQIRTYFRAA